jgi:hypothetical protein
MGGKDRRRAGFGSVSEILRARINLRAECCPGLGKIDKHDRTVSSHKRTTLFFFPHLRSTLPFFYRVVT